MNLFLDTEFNGFNGPLISMALVPESPAVKPFYESLGCENPEPWVAEHVMPILEVEPISKETFQGKLAYYLNAFFDEVTIIADWHEDIAHFCDSLTTGPGTRLNTPALKFEIRRDLETIKPKNPHNALSDALAMRDSNHFNIHR